MLRELIELPPHHASVADMNDLRGASPSRYTDRVLPMNFLESPTNFTMMVDELIVVVEEKSNCSLSILRLRHLTSSQGRQFGAN